MTAGASDKCVIGVPIYPISSSNYKITPTLSLYDFTVKDSGTGDDHDVLLSEYWGRVVLIVNVASLCSLATSQYKELNVLYDKYKPQGFQILAFPCNQFLLQEPGSDQEIRELVRTKFNAEFRIFDKIKVNGKDAAPLYKFLKSAKGGFIVDNIKWNFTKFLVNKEGKVVERYNPTTLPRFIERDIQDLLAASYGPIGMGKKMKLL